MSDQVIYDGLDVVSMALAGYFRTIELRDNCGLVSRECAARSLEHRQLAAGSVELNEIRPDALPAQEVVERKTRHACYRRARAARPPAHRFGVGYEPNVSRIV